MQRSVGIRRAMNALVLCLAVQAMLDEEEQRVMKGLPYRDNTDFFDPSFVEVDRLIAVKDEMVDASDDDGDGDKKEVTTKGGKVIATATAIKAEPAATRYKPKEQTPNSRTVRNVHWHYCGGTDNNDGADFYGCT